MRHIFIQRTRCTFIRQSKSVNVDRR